MTDPLDRLRQPVEPLAPPAGTFDELLIRARRRRTARTAVLAALAVVVLAVGGGLAVNVNPSLSGSLVGPPAGGASVAPTPPAPSASTTTEGPPTVGTPSPYPSSAPVTVGPSAPAAVPGGPVPRGFLPYSFTSVGGGIEYLLGNAPCSTPPCTSIVRTTDGGHTWVGLPAPVAPLTPWQGYPANPGSTVRDLRFASSRDGWAYGGALYSTHDGSHTWHRVDPGGIVLDLATDGTITYAVVATCSAQGYSCTNARLRFTPAPGDQWQDVPGVAGGTAGQVSLAGNGGVALLTDSSGQSSTSVRLTTGWSLDRSAPCAGDTSGVVKSATGNRIFLFCGRGAAGSLILQTYVSDDFGASWRLQPGPALRLADGTRGSTAAATPDVVFATMLSPGFPNTVARSRNGGDNWADAALPSLPGGWRYVGATNATSLVALPANPDGSIWTSTDGGATWTSYRFR